MDSFQRGFFSITGLVPNMAAAAPMKAVLTNPIDSYLIVCGCMNNENREQIVTEKIEAQPGQLKMRDVTSAMMTACDYARMRGPNLKCFVSLMYDPHGLNGGVRADVIYSEEWNPYKRPLRLDMYAEEILSLMG